MNFYQASKTAKTPGQKRCLLVLPNGAVVILQFTADQPLLVTCFFPNDVLDEYRRRQKSGRFWQRTVRCYVRTYAEDVARQPRHPRTEYTVEVENRQGGPVLRSRIHFVLPENWGFEQETPAQLVWSNRLPDWPAATRERAAGPMDHQATSARARYPLSPRPASTAGGVEHE